MDDSITLDPNMVYIQVSRVVFVFGFVSFILVVFLFFTSSSSSSLTPSCFVRDVSVYLITNFAVTSINAQGDFRQAIPRQIRR